MIAEKPTLKAFLTAPASEVAKVAPATVIYAPGGTRRRAVLEGITPNSDEYARWTRQRMSDGAATFFNLGVRHLFMSVLRPRQMAEVGRYRERLLSWLDDGLAGAEALADYAARGWRVRIFGTVDIPELHDTAARLAALPAAPGAPTLWFYVVATDESPWRALQPALAAPTQAEAIRRIYGEDIPLSTLYVGFGKPIIVPDLLPPLLAGEAQAYWTQQPGYDLDEQTLRRIIYDYTYLRQTWSAEKLARYEDVPQQRATWSQRLVLGLGRRIGAFWYPIAPGENYASGREA